MSDSPVRIVLVGYSYTGKTSLLCRFSKNEFSSTGTKTEGVDYKVREINVDGESVKLQIWDFAFAGEENFRNTNKLFYNRAQGFVLVFDVTALKSYTCLSSFIELIRTEAPPNTSIILCANKTDCHPDEWQIQTDVYQNFAKDNNLPLVETSATSGKGVVEVTKIYNHINFLALNRRLPPLFFLLSLPLIAIHFTQKIYSYSRSSVNMSIEN